MHREVEDSRTEDYDAYVVAAIDKHVNPMDKRT